MAGIDKALPHLRWGVLGTGWISSMFTQDLLASRSDATATHNIVAIGSSSVEKGTKFVNKLWASKEDKPKPQVYDNYEAVYHDANVDIVYVGTPHSLHKRNCLDAIAAGKHVLCEKPFTINEKEAREVVEAAQKKGVFIMEAVWTRFFPLLTQLYEHIHVHKSIGEVHRAFIDFGHKLDLESLPANDRKRDPSLGAGALLDIGIYTLTYASIVMGEGKTGKEHPGPKKVVSKLDVVKGVDESSVVVLDYPAADGVHSKTAICSSTFHFKSGHDFARIEGSNGHIIIFGIGASVPGGFRMKIGPAPGHGEIDKREEQVFNVEKPEGTLGFFWEADAVAQDIANGRKENTTMPLEETLRMMRLMDGIRQDGGLRYPQDDQ